MDSEKIIQETLWLDTIFCIIDRCQKDKRYQQVLRDRKDIFHQLQFFFEKKSVTYIAFWMEKLNRYDISKKKVTATRISETNAFPGDWTIEKFWSLSASIPRKIHKSKFPYCGISFLQHIHEENFMFIKNFFNNLKF